MKNPTVRELLEKINPGYSSLEYYSGSLKGAKKYMDTKVNAYWIETFTTLFAYKDKTGRLRIFTAVNVAPLCSAHKSETSRYQKISLAQIRTDIGLNFLEEKTGKTYPELRKLYIAKEGEFLGTIELKSSSPIISYDYQSKDYTYIEHRPMSIDVILTVYRRKGNLRIRHQYGREVSEHNRIWKGHNLTLGMRKKKYVGYAADHAPGTHYTYCETTTTLPDDVYKELLALQVVETL